MFLVYSGPDEGFGNALSGSPPTSLASSPREHDTLPHPTLGTGSWSSIKEAGKPTLEHRESYNPE